jgi:hypothetical protein
LKWIRPGIFTSFADLEAAMRDILERYNASPDAAQLQSFRC